MIFPRELFDPTFATSALPDAPVVPDAPARGSRLRAAHNARQAWKAIRAGTLVRVQVRPPAGELG